MRFLTLAALFGLAVSAAPGRTKRSPLHVGKRDLHEAGASRHQGYAMPREILEERAASPPGRRHYYKKPGKTILPQNSNTTFYGVDGTKIPEVNFDIGESYAGLMPVSDYAGETRSFYFWFFPSSNPLAKDEITIWLNGGPGCSSLEGFFQENGPVIWQYGTFRPVKNPYTWVNLTNMVWVEQPIGTGFSQGKATETNEEQVAKTFLGFFKRFIDTFGLHHKKIYVTGESYAGYYVPYITSAMLDRKDKTYYDAQGLMIYDPSTSYEEVQNDIPTLPFVEFHNNLFHLNDTFMASIRQRDQSCGYADFRSKYMKFPPPGKFPKPPSNTKPGCSIWNDVFNAALLVNPCFDLYQVATTCPLLYDVLGFPGSIPYLPPGTDIYFNRTDVQMAINAPIEEWAECSDGVLDTDTSLPSGLSVLPKTIERLKRTIIAHGELDYVLIGNGTLMMIQNMTWGGKQGFQKEPVTPFLVPYHSELSLETLAGAGRMGTTHTERGLTWINTWLSGHMVPQYAPSAAYRQLEYLLGRVDSLNTLQGFTTQK